MGEHQHAELPRAHKYNHRNSNAMQYVQEAYYSAGLAEGEIGRLVTAMNRYLDLLFSPNIDADNKAVLIGKLEWVRGKLLVLEYFNMGGDNGVKTV